MTDPMISPDPQPPHAVRSEAERSAAFVTKALTGRRRAAKDLAADRADALVVPPRRRRVDLSTSGNRIRYGFLGETARDALADLQEEYEQRDDTRDLDAGLAAAHERVRQVLRLSATVAEPMPSVELGDELAVDMWGLPCPACDAADDMPCVGVSAGTAVHVDRVLGVLIVAAMDNPAVLELVLKLPGSLQDVAPYAAAAGAGVFEPVRGQL